MQAEYISKNIKSVRKNKNIEQTGACDEKLETQYSTTLGFDGLNLRKYHIQDQFNSVSQKIGRASCRERVSTVV